MTFEKNGFKNGSFYFVKPETEFEILLHQIFGILFLTLILLLFICHIGSLIYNYRALEMESKMVGDNYVNNIFPRKSDKMELGNAYYYIYIIHILTILAFFAAALNVISLGVLHYLLGILIHDSCAINTKLNALAWFITRFLVYYICILRIFIIFEGSYFDYSKKFKRILVSLMLCIHGYNLMSFLFFIKGYNMTTNGIKWCQMEVKLPHYFIGGLLEIVTNVLLLILFIKPLILLVKSSETPSTTSMEIIAKVSLLTIMAILSTFGTIGLVAFSYGTFGAYFDSCFNLIFILLLNKIHKKYYNKICKLCHNKMYNICIYYTKKQKTQDVAPI